MEPIESITFVVAVVLSLVLWSRWYLCLVRVRRLALSGRGMLLLALAPVVAWATTTAVVLAYGDAVVRASPLWIAFYLFLGMAWTGGVALLMPLLGIHPFIDAIERRNAIAAWPVAGTLIGAGLAFAGGNIGDGPGFWVVLFSAALSTGALIGLLIVVGVVARTDLRVTVDRDPAAAFRLGLLAICMGAMLGRAVAGDWVSPGATVREFLRDGWPAAALAMIEIGVARFPRTPRPNGRFELDLPGLFAGFVSIGFTVTQLIVVGWWR
ncbi:MAG TPA: hypothetical protein PKC43_04985 [Phycisphaerales bacterium]|nr:hypothetical protein [Phycisphaerales bacterium]HMP36784.1 hypothetical protein [Phycisphaerales bacterium]